MSLCSRWVSLFLVLPSVALASDLPKKTILQLGYENIDSESTVDKFRSYSNAINLKAIYLDDLITSYGASVLFNKVDSSEPASGSFTSNTVGGSLLATRYIAPGLSVGGTLGYFKGSGDLSAVTSPGVTFNSPVQVFALSAGLDQFIAVARRISGLVGGTLSGYHRKSDAVSGSGVSIPEDSALLAGFNAHASLTYYFSGEFQLSALGNFTHTTKISNKGYVETQPIFSLAWLPANPFNAKVFYGLGYGQGRESRFGGLNVSYLF